jgi:hypothetical protein
MAKLPTYIRNLPKVLVFLVAIIALEDANSVARELRLHDELRKKLEQERVTAET